MGRGMIKPLHEYRFFRSVGLRRLLYFVVSLLVIVLGVALYERPATTWSRAFCAPVSKVVGYDVSPLITSLGPPRGTWPSPAQQERIDLLRHDVHLAELTAATSQLRSELSRDHEDLSGAITKGSVGDAERQIKQTLSVQLESCGIHPLGH